MASFIDQSYDKLGARASRIENFFADLEGKLSSLSTPEVYHLDIYWDGGKVRRTSDSEWIQTLSMKERLKYYNQGLGLMKLAINKSLYPG